MRSHRSEDQGDGDDQDPDHNQAKVNHYDDHDDGADQDYHDDDPHTAGVVGGLVMRSPPLLKRSR